jgi:hypothetical protein
VTHSRDCSRASRPIFPLPSPVAILLSGASFARVALSGSSRSAEAIDLRRSRASQTAPARVWDLIGEVKVRGPDMASAHLFVKSGPFQGAGPLRRPPFPSNSLASITAENPKNSLDELFRSVTYLTAPCLIAELFCRAWADGPSLSEMSGGAGLFGEMQLWRVTAVADFLPTEIVRKFRLASLLAINSRYHGAFND